MTNAFGSTPCGPLENCHIIDCGSDEGITDRDLAILLNQEYPKVEPDNDKEEKEGKEGHRECTKKKGKNEGNTEERRKKRPCRKVIKNPFFTNRLKFSTDLPPRPPLPPPQFFPLADEDSKPKVCVKKKKCRKKKKSKTEYEEEECEEEEEECEEETECDTNSCACKDECEDRTKRRCKKPKDNKALGPCRKKLSETSIPPQPRRIPALLKDLPTICPKNIPEVERQIRMSQDHTLQRNACKRKCKKKEKVEELLNL